MRNLRGLAPLDRRPHAGGHLCIWADECIDDARGSRGDVAGERDAFSPNGRTRTGRGGVPSGNKYAGKWHRCYRPGMTRPILADALGHHVWATLLLIDACLPLTDEQLAAADPGTFGSILDTVRHLVGADCSYLELLSGGARCAPSMKRRWTSRRCAPRWRRTGPSGPRSSPVTDPDRMVIRHRDDGSESHAPLGIRLAQVTHHGTDHRSQDLHGTHKISE